MNLGIAEIRNNLADALNRVAYQGERVILERRGKGVAAIVSINDLELLEAIEDYDDVRTAKRALAAMKRKGEKPIPLADIISRLGQRGTGQRGTGQRGTAKRGTGRKGSQ